MMHSRWVKASGVVAVALLATGAAVLAGGNRTIGKNPGKIKGRWLEVKDASALAAYKGVYVGDLRTEIQWKNPRNEAPIDEDLLAEKVNEQLMKRLKESGVFGEVLESPPEEGAEGYVRLDCDLEVEPGSRVTRWAVGFGAGKSRSILEIHLRDHQSGEEVALYHGYGVGSGMGFKLGGGSARKMTQDDIQENTKQFVELLGEVL